MLAGAPITHLVVYAHDVAESARFYHQRLGLPMVEDDSSCLSAGGVKIWLRSAGDHGVQLFGRRDDSSDVVFLVEDLERMRAALEGRGVQFDRRRSYEVGLVTDFYDPNGHRLMLYQPSDTALTWPSGPKLREVWRRYGFGGTDVIGPASGPAREPDTERGLAGSPLAYLFMFENDQTAALKFYRDALGLTLLERVHCCNQDCDQEIEGIGKYDGGAVLLSTHHMHERSMVFDDLGRPYSPREFNPTHGQGIAPVFEVSQIHHLVPELTGRGVRFPYGVQEYEAGLVARFEDPFGHPFLLLEPAPHRQRPATVGSAV